MLSETNEKIRFSKKERDVFNNANQGIHYTDSEISEELDNPQEEQVW